MSSPSQSSKKHRPNRAPTVWIDGNLTDSPTISAWDPGLLLGLGVFETLLFRNGVPLCLSRHHQRLTTGAAAIGIDVPPLDSIRRSILETVSANGLSEARIRITLTGDPSCPAPRSTVLSAVPPVIPTEPASAVSAPFRRNPDSPLSGIKSTSYAENILAHRFAKSLDADEAILCDTAGNLSEATSSNLFFVLSGNLHTPPLSTGCLPGITRDLILELCEKNGLPLIVHPTPPSALANAAEAFLTSSIRGVHPLACFDGQNFSKAPGPVTSMVKNWFDALLRENHDP